MSTSDFSNELTGRIGDAAAAIDHGDSTAVLAEVHGTVGRRRRRRQGVAGVAAVGALVASGVVVALLASSNGDEELVLSAPATEPADNESGTAAPDDTTSTADGSSTGGAPAEAPVDQPLEDAQPVVPNAEGSAAGVPFVVSGATVEYFGDQLERDELRIGVPSQVVGWNGGFLAITTVSEPQTLPNEFPPEIAEQFPQEVNDLFADGLPPTINEAIAILQEVGLYDVVEEVVLENPDVFDAVYGQPVNVLSTARFSTDGETWEEIDAAIPPSVLQGASLVAAGDRLVAVSHEGEMIVVRSSTDLVEWDEQTIATPQPPGDLSDAIRFDVSTGQITANADRWVLNVSTFGGFDPGPGLEGPLNEQVRNGQADYELLEEGVRFTVRRGPDYEELPDDEVATTVVPWSQWGLDGEPQTDDLFSNIIYTAAWGQEVQESDASSDQRFSGQLLALDDGFVDLSHPLRFSADGLDWVELEPPFSGFVSWGIQTERGFLIAAVDEFRRTSGFAFDRAESTWTQVDLTDVPSDSSRNGVADRVALLTDFGDPFQDLVAAQLMTAEVDGYRFEQRSEMGENLAVTYTVTNVESGEVVSTETLSDDDDFGTEFEFATTLEDADGEGQAGIRLLDPATGEPLVAIPYESVTWTRLDAAGDPVADDAFNQPLEPSDPDVWIVAAAGDGVVVEQLESDNQLRYTVGAASNGEIVLVAFADGTFARIALT